MPPTAAHFEKMLLPHLDAAYNIARWLTRNRQDAEDLVQESYLRALHSFHGLHSEADGRAWLLKIVRNTCYTWLRKNRIFQSSTMPIDEAQHPDTAASNPEISLIKAANLRLVRNALEQLPLEYREAIVLREFEKFSYKQIAEITNTPVETVMSRLSRGRKELLARCRATTEEVGK